MRHLISRPPMRGLVVLAALSAAVACESGRAPAGNPATSPDVDPRTPVVLPADGHQAVLREMRQMLAAMGGAMAAAARADTAGVIVALAPAGSAAAADPALEALLPETWKELAERTHGGFDTLTTTVRGTTAASELKDSVLTGLARISGSCAACHEAFRLSLR